MRKHMCTKMQLFFSTSKLCKSHLQAKRVDLSTWAAFTGKRGTMSKTPTLSRSSARTGRFRVFTSLVLKIALRNAFAARRLSDSDR